MVARWSVAPERYCSDEPEKSVESKGKSMSAQSREVAALVREVAKIEPSEFAQYGGGWPDQIGLALLDAVFSIRAKYNAKTEGHGVLGRVVAFRETHSDAVDDLERLAALGGDEIARIMGESVTSSRRKADCVVEAATALLALEPTVRTARDARATDPKAVQAAYVGVHGLGWVTAKYFLMLLGAQDVKADSMIQRFVNSALREEGLETVDAAGAYELVIAAHGADDHGVGLTEFEHAIWRRKGALIMEAEPGA